MGIEVIEFKGKRYPAFQSTCNSARFILPVVLEVCKGVGFDIGCGKIDWCLSGAIPIDPEIPLQNHYEEIYPNELVVFTATFLPKNLDKIDCSRVDYIFSSHCLEHLNDWVGVLDYWVLRIRSGGVLFLYLPHPSQEYWKPWNNRKHVNILYPDMIEEYMKDRGLLNVFVSGCDLNSSFSAIAEIP